MPTERPGAVTVAGRSMTLVGDELRAGSRAPDFSLIGIDYQPVRLASFQGKTCVFLSLPSLDTSVCDLEARTFSQRAAELPGVEILAVSVDLPGAQKRWCGAAGVDNLTLGSDHKDVSFGRAYGVLIKEARTLCRASFVVNADGRVTYAESLTDIGHQPDYDAVIRAAREAAGAPA